MTLDHLQRQCRNERWPRGRATHLTLIVIWPDSLCDLFVLTLRVGWCFISNYFLVLLIFHALDLWHEMFSASSFEILKYKLVGFACLSNSETFSVTHYELNLCHTAHIFLSLTIRPQQLVCWYWGLQDYTFFFWDFLYSCWSLCQHRKKRTFWMITTNKRTNLQEQTDFYMKWAGTQGGG